jgi:hypothetical protein
MVCVVGTNYGAPHAVPLNIMNLQFDVQCHISQAFVHMQLVCHYPMVSQQATTVQSRTVCLADPLAFIWCATTHGEIQLVKATMCLL